MTFLQCAKTVMENSDVIVGIKVRLDENITDGGRNEHELYLRAKRGRCEFGLMLCLVWWTKLTLLRS